MFNSDPTSDLSSSSSSSSSSSASSSSSSSASASASLQNVSTEVLLYQRSSTFTIVISSILGVLIFCTILGNIFVIYAILFDRILRRVGNYLVLSLAIADFMVACTVMPISALYEVTGAWTFGSLLCEIWISADVLCCTASILHLLAIALDRYWAVTQVNHIQQRNAFLVGKMITAVWTVSLLISLAPTLGWKDPYFLKRIEESKDCLISQDIAYQIFATVSSFYAPLVVILLLYWKIYKVAKKRIRHKPGRNMTTNLRHATASLVKSDSNHCKEIDSTCNVNNNNSINNTNKTTSKSNDNEEDSNITAADNKDCRRNFTSLTADTTTTTNAINNSDNNSAVNNNNTTGSTSNNVVYKSESLPREEIISVKCTESSPNKLDSGSTKSSSLILRSTNSSSQSKAYCVVASNIGPKETLEAKRERKAAKTLAIITGVFVICWLPFFILALIRPICGDTCSPPKMVQSIFSWLGFTNSTLNPIIYTIFSPEFRTAFERILLGRQPINSRATCNV